MNDDGCPVSGPEVTYEALKRSSVTVNGCRSPGDTRRPGWNSSSAVTVLENEVPATSSRSAR